MLVLFTNLSLMEFQVSYLALLRLFSVIEAFDWFWMVSGNNHELESDLRDTVVLGRKRPVHVNAGKTQLVSFGLSNNPGAIDVKMNVSELVEKSSFKMLELFFPSKLD